MDSFVASVASGTQIRNCTIKNIFKIALIMGALQAMLTLIGFLAGHGFERFITFYDHWIAFVLLSYLGGKMIYEGFKKDDSDEVQEVLS
ncbi:MAG: manganese efflux pump MntP family protein, partial [Tannerellaceae bacterium]